MSMLPRLWRLWRQHTTAVAILSAVCIAPAHTAYVETLRGNAVVHAAAGVWMIGAGVVFALSGVVMFLNALLPLKQNRNPHACPSCGYDLRATPERCPECGKEVST